MSDDDRLSALAARFDVPGAVALRADELALLPRDDDGSLGATAARRMRLIGFALSRGIPEQQLLSAMHAYGDLVGSFDELAPAPVEGLDLDALVAAVELDRDLMEDILAAIGADPHGPLTEDDLEAARSARQALDLGLPPNVLLQLLRVFAENMERLAEAENRIFHDNVHESFRAEGLRGRDLMGATSAIGTGLLKLVEPTVLYFHRRAWTRAAQYDFLRHLTEDSRPLPRTPGAASCAVMFADLSGFTPLTAAMGDDAAAEVLVRFANGVRRLTSEHDGRVVKQIGDAFMLVFDDVTNAVLCGVGILEWCSSETHFPAVHIGGHAGEVLFREGDFVGGVVNLAARIASSTQPTQFLVTDVMLEAAELPSTIPVVPLGRRRLKGLHDPIALTAVGPQHVGQQAMHDPVCGMSVDDDAPSHAWGGRTWHFCSSTCARAFASDPDRYEPR